MSDHECPLLVEGSDNKFKIQTQKENKEREIEMIPFKE